MTLGQLRALFRAEAHDCVGPDFLWSATEVDSFANEALQEAVRRGVSILDSTTPAVCSIDYSTDPLLTFDPRIIKIQRAIIAGQSLPLEEASARWLDEVYPGWLTHQEQHPTMYVADYQSSKIRLSAIPTLPGTLNLTVLREPLDPLVEDHDVPEIPARYHRSLVDGMLAIAYRKDDTETEKGQRFLLAEQRFTKTFGERKSARNERWMSQQLGAFADTLC